MKFSVLMSLCFLVAACTPKDTLLSTNNNKNNTNDNQNVVVMSAAESDKLLAVTMDKVVESLVFVRAYLDESYRSQVNLNIAKIDDEDDIFSKVMTKKINLFSSDVASAPVRTMVSSPSDSVQGNAGSNPKKGKNDNKKAQVSLSVVVDQVEFADDHLIKLVLTIPKDKVLLNRALLNKDDFESDTTAGTITVTKLFGSENIYSVVVSKMETTNSKADKKTTIETTLKFRIVWDGRVETLSQDLVLNRLFVKADRTGGKSGSFKYIDNGLDLKLSLSSCSVLNGEAQLVAITDTAAAAADTNISPDNTRVLHFNKSNIEFQDGSKTTSAYKACEIGAIVDLTRFLQ